MRLGRSIRLDENIYTLAFVSELTNEEIDLYTQEDEGKPPQKDNVRQTPRGTVVGLDNCEEDEASFLEQEAEMLKWEAATVKRYETYKQERIRLTVHVFVTMVCQLLIVYLLFKQAFADFDLR